MAARVLVVDDDERVRTVVSWQLTADGHTVINARDGAGALDELDKARPDLIVLDLSMPGISGLDVLRRVRETEAMSGAQTALPVIVLSGRSGETERIVGLDLGADDYLVKPFSPGELAARVRSVLRRTDPPERRLHFDGLVVDPATRAVTVGGEPVELTAREFDLLEFLARHPRQVFSRAQLLHHVWRSVTVGRGEAEGHTVTEHMRRMRHKLEADPAHPRWLRTVRGVGYQLEP